MPKPIQCIHLEARDLPDAWFQAVYAALEHGREFVIDQGSYAGQKRLEFDYFTCQIVDPGFPHNGEGPDRLLPRLNPVLGLPDPVEPGYVAEYFANYIMAGEYADYEAYSYGSRLANARIWAQDVQHFGKAVRQGTYNTLHGPAWWFFNQIDMAVQTYVDGGHRNNQVVLQVAQPGDMALADPPCLRHIDTRVQDGQLIFFPYFRSWDLWGGFPANLAAIRTLQEYMAGEIGVEAGPMVVSSKGLHLYRYVWELAEAVRGRTIDELRK